MSNIDKKARYYQAREEVLLNKGTNCTDAVIFGLILYRSNLNHGHYAVATNQYIADKIGVDPDTVKSSLGRLEKHGFIRRSGRGWRRRMYPFRFENVTSPELKVV